MMKLPTISTLPKVKAVHALVACGVICTAVVIWYFVFSLPAQHQAELDTKERIEQMKIDEKKRAEEKELARIEEEKSQKEVRIMLCEIEAWETYKSEWTRKCESHKRLAEDNPYVDYEEDENGNCYLPTTTSDSLDKMLKEEEQKCYDRNS